MFDLYDDFNKNEPAAPVVQPIERTAEEHHWLGIQEEKGLSMPICLCGWKRLDPLEFSMAAQIDAFAEHVAKASQPAPLPSDGPKKENQMYTEESAKLAELCSAWFEGTGEEMAQHIADEIRSRAALPVGQKETK